MKIKNIDEYIRKGGKIDKCPTMHAKGYISLSKTRVNLLWEELDDYAYIPSETKPKQQYDYYCNSTYCTQNLKNKNGTLILKNTTKILKFCPTCKSGVYLFSTRSAGKI